MPILVVTEEELKAMKFAAIMLGEASAKRLETAAPGGLGEQLWTAHALQASIAKKALETKVISTEAMVTSIVQERKEVFPNATAATAAEAFLSQLELRFNQLRMMVGWSHPLEDTVKLFMLQVMSAVLRQEEE